MNILFKIEYTAAGIKITNESNFNLWISNIPIKPKRKLVDILVIKAGNFIILPKGFKIDFLRCSFSFKKEGG